MDPKNNPSSFNPSNREIIEEDAREAFAPGETGNFSRFISFLFGLYSPSGLSSAKMTSHSFIGNIDSKSLAVSSWMLA